MIGIIIPIYKAQGTIRSALDSLITQTNKDFVVIPSIDGDTTDYSCIWKDYSRRGLVIRPVYNQLNCGPGIARQKGIEAARNCDYLTFLDADDLLIPTAIDIFTKYMQSKKLDVLATNFYWEQTPHSFFNLDNEKLPVTWMHGKCYRKSFLLKNKIEFLPDFRINEDSYFNLVVWNTTNKKLKINDPTYVWRYNKNSLTHMYKGKQLFEKIMETYVNTQIFGILKIIEIKDDIDTLVFIETLKNIYEYIMKQEFYQIKQRNYIENFSLLKESPVVQSEFRNIELWEYAKKVPQGSNVDYDFFFYKSNFLDFLKEYIINDSYN